MRAMRSGAPLPPRGSGVIPPVRIGGRESGGPRQPSPTTAHLGGAASTALGVDMPPLNPGPAFSIQAGGRPGRRRTPCHVDADACPHGHPWTEENTGIPGQRFAPSQDVFTGSVFHRERGRGEGGGVRHGTTPQRRLDPSRLFFSGNQGFSVCVQSPAVRQARGQVGPGCSPRRPRSGRRTASALAAGR